MEHKIEIFLFPCIPNIYGVYEKLTIQRIHKTVNQCEMCDVLSALDHTEELKNRA